MDAGTLAALGTFAAITAPLATYIGNLYRKRIAELEAEIVEREQREKRIINALLQGSKDEAELAVELARVITGDYRRNG